MVRALILGIALAAVCYAAAAQAEPRPGTAAAALRVDLAEWSIVPSAGIVRAGRVRIEVRNLGVRVHQLVLARTKLFADELPLRGDHAVVRPLAAPLVIRPGADRTFEVSLRPGSYLLLDNLAWHYWKGMSVAFAVR